jgi:hypothetical protein
MYSQILYLHILTQTVFFEGRLWLLGREGGGVEGRNRRNKYRIDSRSQIESRGTPKSKGFGEGDWLGESSGRKRVCTGRQSSLTPELMVKESDIMEARSYVRSSL